MPNFLCELTRRKRLCVLGGVAERCDAIVHLLPTTEALLHAHSHLHDHHAGVADSVPGVPGSHDPQKGDIQPDEVEQRVFIRNSATSSPCP